jgi:hypothetical protein
MGKKRPPTLQLDPELARLSIGLHLASEFRLWVVGRHLNRDETGSGKVAKKEFFTALRNFGIKYSRQHRRRLLNSGERLFWNEDKKYIYVRSSQHVAREFTQLAIDNNPALLSNRAGVIEVYIPPAGSLEQWEANIYAGWLDHRENPIIARETLEGLFGRTPETLRRWEQDRLQGTLTIQKNYAQCALVDTMEKVNPERLNSYVAKTDDGAQLRLVWQMPNTYIVRGIKTHPRKGQSKKVRKAVNVQLQQPANDWRGGSPVCKLYFEGSKSLKQHLKKYEGVYYLWRGRNRHKHGIYEATETGVWETQAKERMQFGTERRIKAEGKLYMSY